MFFPGSTTEISGKRSGQKGNLMPKYELMYIIGNKTSEDEIPGVVNEVKDIITDQGGSVDKHEELGKKKFAYPIKKAKMGYYVLVYFSVEAKKSKEIEDRIRTHQNIVRHLILNYEEAERRMKKDKVAQAKLQSHQPAEKSEPAKSTKEDKPASREKTAKPASDKKIEIDLDAEIEKALESEDLK